VADPRSRPVSRVGRCRRVMRPSPHPADAVTQNRRALADVACVVLDTDTTSWYSLRQRLVDRGAVCVRLDGRELTTFPRCIDPERPKPQMCNRLTASPMAVNGVVYVVADCYQSGCKKTFRLDRIRECWLAQDSTSLLSQGREAPDP
jgi:hypothetical protein